MALGYQEWGDGSGPPSIKYSMYATLLFVFSQGESLGICFDVYLAPAKTYYLPRLSNLFYISAGFVVICPSVVLPWIIL